MNTPSPTALVTVILPTYNRASVIGRAIASVVAQSYPHWELIVVDDASTDSTAQVVQQFTDARVYYVRLPFNCGHPSRPRNIGWQMARGFYIAYIDDDNAWRPDHLARLVAAAEAHPEAAGAYGGRCNHLPDGTTEDLVDPNRNIDTGDGLHRRDLIGLMPEMWTETHFTNEDLEFWGRLRQRHPVGLVWVPHVLSDYYIHDGNRFTTHWLNFRRYDLGYYTRHSAWLDDPDRLGRYVALALSFNPRRVLDVGCGRGWVVQALRERGVDAWGVDPSPTATRLTEARPFHLRAAADRLPFPTGAFDVVLCTDVLAHVPEAFVERTLREMLRVAGGPLVAAIDCVNPTRDGHTTMRPRQWWLDQLGALGATTDDGFVAGWLTHGTRLPDGLELVVAWPEAVRRPKSMYDLDLLAA